MSEMIYMPLLDEGTEVWRPVAVEPLGNDRYRILGEPAEDEEWAFSPGQTVIGCKRLFQGEEKLIAVSEV